jgi:hypothetical protein
MNGLFADAELAEDSVQQIFACGFARSDQSA